MLYENVYNVNSDEKEEDVLKNVGDYIVETGNYKNVYL